MTEMKKHIYDESNSLWYELIGDYYIPILTLSSEEQRPIGKWGRMHRDYLKEHRPILFNDLVLSDRLWTYLADLNEQAQDRLSLIIIYCIMKLPKVADQNGESCISKLEKIAEAFG